MCLSWEAVTSNLGCLVSETLLALLKDVLLDATALGEGDHVGLVLLADAENVANTGGEGLALGVLDVDNVEATRVLVAGSDGSDATVILTLGDNAGSASLELDEVGHLARLEVNLDGVVDLHEGVWVADGAAIVGGDVWDTLGAELELVDTAQLVCALVSEGLLVVKTVEHESALGVEKHTELLVSLVEGDDIGESTWEVGVGAAAAVDLHQAHHANLLDLLLGECVLETVTEDEHQGKALAELVGTGGGAWGPGSTHLVKHPVLGGIKPLHMLLWTTSL
jgi:hypothetical protein